jgi:hypothetical protein
LSVYGQGFKREVENTRKKTKEKRGFQSLGLNFKKKGVGRG